MIRKLLFKMTANRPCRLISRDGQPYMERYYLFSLGGVIVYLHRFVGSDGDLEVHDHPWRAASLVLVGGYEEELATMDVECGWQSRYRNVNWFNFIGTCTLHRITRTERETWTLFAHGRRLKAWGFLRHWRDMDPPVTIYHNPFGQSNADWWTRAPKGSMVGRQPLPRMFR